MSDARPTVCSRACKNGSKNDHEEKTRGLHRTRRSRSHLRIRTRAVDAVCNFDNSHNDSDGNDVADAGDGRRSRVEDTLLPLVCYAVASYRLRRRRRRGGARWRDNVVNFLDDRRDGSDRVYDVEIFSWQTRGTTKSRQHQLTERSNDFLRRNFKRFPSVSQ